VTAGRRVAGGSEASSWRQAAATPALYISSLSHLMNSNLVVDASYQTLLHYHAPLLIMSARLRDGHQRTAGAATQGRRAKARGTYVRSKDSIALGSAANDVVRRQTRAPSRRRGRHIALRHARARTWPSTRSNGSAYLPRALARAQRQRGALDGCRGGMGNNNLLCAHLPRSLARGAFARTAVWRRASRHFSGLAAATLPAASLSSPFAGDARAFSNAWRGVVDIAAWRTQACLAFLFCMDRLAHSLSALRRASSSPSLALCHALLFLCLLPASLAAEGGISVDISCCSYFHHRDLRRAYRALP